MPTRRQALQGMMALSLSPMFAFTAGRMEQKLLPMVPFQNKARLGQKDYKEYLLLAMNRIEEFIDIHKVEIIQYGLLIIALSLILASGIPPTKELILFLL
jgi:hypothetical protein